MARAYSEDLRGRALDLLESGQKQQAVSKLLNIGLSTGCWQHFPYLRQCFIGIFGDDILQYLGIGYFMAMTFLIAAFSNPAPFCPPCF